MKTSKEAQEVESSQFERSGQKDGMEDVILRREVTFVEEITSTGQRRISEVRSACFDSLGQLVSDEDARLVARACNVNLDEDQSIYGYPCRGTLCEAFEAWPGVESQSLRQP